MSQGFKNVTQINVLFISPGIFIFVARHLLLAALRFTHTALLLLTHTLAALSWLTWLSWLPWLAWLPWLIWVITTARAFSWCPSIDWFHMKPPFTD
jgi:hypothetical protein